MSLYVNYMMNENDYVRLSLAGLASTVTDVYLETSLTGIITMELSC